MRRKGFTLTETMIAIAVFAIMSTVVFSFVTALYRAQELLFVQSDLLEEARRGMEQMVREIREAGPGENGSYMIAKADGHEIIFYSDLSGDGMTEMVRYYINPAGGRIGSVTQNCTSFQAGGSCQVTFSNFLENDLKNATLSVSIEGDLDHPSREYADIVAGVDILGTLCRGGGACGQCAGEYQDLRSFDVTDLAATGIFSVTVSASSHVDPICQWEDPDHSIKALLVLSWEEEPLPQQTDLFLKDVSRIEGWPPSYGDPETTVISRSVRNEARGEPVFRYYDVDGSLIEDPEARINDIGMVEMNMILNPDPGRPPDDLSLVSAVQLRNHRPYDR